MSPEACLQLDLCKIFVHSHLPRECFYQYLEVHLWAKVGLILSAWGSAVREYIRPRHLLLAITIAKKQCTWSRVDDGELYSWRLCLCVFLFVHTVCWGLVEQHEFLDWGEHAHSQARQIQHPLYILIVGIILLSLWLWIANCVFLWIGICSYWSFTYVFSFFLYSCHVSVTSELW